MEVQCRYPAEEDLKIVMILPGQNFCIAAEETGAASSEISTTMKTGEVMEALITRTDGLMFVILLMVAFSL